MARGVSMGIHPDHIPLQTFDTPQSPIYLPPGSDLLGGEVGVKRRRGPQEGDGSGETRAVFWTPETRFSTSLEVEGGKEEKRECSRISRAPSPPRPPNGSIIAPDPTSSSPCPLAVFQVTFECRQT